MTVENLISFYLPGAKQGKSCISYIFGHTKLSARHDPEFASQSPWQSKLMIVLTAAITASLTVSLFHMASLVTPANLSKPPSLITHPDMELSRQSLARAIAALLTVLSSAAFSSSLVSFGSFTSSMLSRNSNALHLSIWVWDSGSLARLAMIETSWSWM